MLFVFEFGAVTFDELICMILNIVRDLLPYLYFIFKSYYINNEISANNSEINS